MDYQITAMTPADWKDVERIYIEGIQTGIATFNTDSSGWEAWDQGHLPFARLVARAEDTVLGWGALSPTSPRPCYAGVAEISLYVDSHYAGLGIGKTLLQAILQESEKNGIWTIEAKILAPNQISLHLHERCGFRRVGYRERPARTIDGIWHDAWLLEYRSRNNGAD